MTILRIAVLICSVTIAGAAPLNAQERGVITGRVLEHATGRPLPLAIVDIIGLSLSALTDTTGAYRITNLPAGIHTLRARRLGYTPLATDSVHVASEAVRDFALKLLPMPLENERGGEVARCRQKSFWRRLIRRQ